MHIVIVGAGLLGVSTAFWLRQGGAAVTVIDTGAGAAQATSFANGGLLTPSQSMPWNEPGVFARIARSIGRESAPVLLRPTALPRYARWGLDFIRNSSQARYRLSTLANMRLAVYSLSQTRALQSALALDDDAAHNGSLKVFRNRRAFEESAEWSQVCREAGLRFERLESADRILALEPAVAAIAPELVGGLYFPDDASGDAHKFAVQLAAHAAAAGVSFRYETTVRALRCDHRGFQALDTTRGRIAADACVIAAASDSATLLAPLGLRVPVQPVKGYSLTLALAGWNAAPRIPLVDDEKHIGATPLGARLRVVGTAEFAGDDRRLRAGRIENLVRFVRTTFPEFAARVDWTTMNPWCGLRPMASDGVPIIGATPVRGLYLNTGHGHLGWTLCAGSGRLLADQLLGRSPALDPAPYALARF